MEEVTIGKKINALLEERGIKKVAVANWLGIDKCSLSRKLKDGTWYAHEIQILTEKLNLTDKEIVNILKY